MRRAIGRRVNSSCRCDFICLIDRRDCSGTWSFLHHNYILHRSHRDVYLSQSKSKGNILFECMQMDPIPLIGPADDKKADWRTFAIPNEVEIPKIMVYFGLRQPRLLLAPVGQGGYWRPLALQSR